ncbi:2-C-methyl-D-erythritol 4-phosphate cytidylyltransferase [Acinetobacter marinus]|uniref:2-C-methyl-D-erythritol 4-phosphate cytidylyltransferase n=2 Tax=Acinetobacter marinus TaxID=281375 RepID=A0A1G6GSU0_9GAMM|nr:2-C-methyl-D-erythritol 4-phosphate cytidylyltransferase [Acinetobacter marinus]
MTRPKLWAVIPAAGSGQRFSKTDLKQYQKILGKTVLEHSVNALYQLPLSGCVIAISTQDTFAEQIEFVHPVQFCQGGKERMDSVFAALKYLESYADANDYILVHDAARPCLHVDQLRNIEKFCQTGQNAAIIAVPVRDTLKKSKANQQIESTVDRTGLWQAQTPQIIKYSILYRALQHATQHQLHVTDEASALEQLNSPIQLIEGRMDNLKITYPQDLDFAKLVLSLKQPT